jgi:hypothetical protein
MVRGLSGPRLLVGLRGVAVFEILGRVRPELFALGTRWPGSVGCFGGLCV